MEFIVNRTSDWFGLNPQKEEAATLSELIDFIRASGYPCIISIDKDTGEITLEIYDRRRE